MRKEIDNYALYLRENGAEELANELETSFHFDSQLFETIQHMKKIGEEYKNFINKELSTCYFDVEILMLLHKNSRETIANHFQKSRQPSVEKLYGIYKNVDHFCEQHKNGFECPLCKGKSSDPQTCNSGIIIQDTACDWKAWGFFSGPATSLFLDNFEFVKHFNGIGIEV